MSPITCSVIKQYMWYYEKYTKMCRSKFLVILFFKCTSMHYVIYENLNEIQLNYEKINYSTKPTEHTFNNCTYCTFSFSNIDETRIIDVLRKHYRIFYIDVELNKTWKERDQYLERYSKPSLFSGMLNVFSNALIDIFYEDPEDEKLLHVEHDTVHNTILPEFGGKLSLLPNSLEFGNTNKDIGIIDTFSKSDSTTHTLENKKMEKSDSLDEFSTMLMEELANKQQHKTSSIFANNDILQSESLSIVAEEPVRKPSPQTKSISVIPVIPVISVILDEEEVAFIKGNMEDHHGDGDFVNLEDEEFVEININPLDKRKYSDIATGKKLVFKTKTN